MKLRTPPLKPTLIRVVLRALLIAAALLIPLVSKGRGQMVPLRLPMTMVLERTVAGKSYESSRIITLGIGRDRVSFVLREINVEDPRRATTGDDVWREVRQFRPNMTIRGSDGARVAAARPGEVLSLQGCFSFASRTFEISAVRYSY